MIQTKIYVGVLKGSFELSWLEAFPVSHVFVRIKSGDEIEWAFFYSVLSNVAKYDALSKGNPP